MLRVPSGIPRVLPVEVEMILNRLALAALCVLPALATRLPAPGTPIVATFMYACDSEEPRPKLTTPPEAVSNRGLLPTPGTRPLTTPSQRSL